PGPVLGGPVLGGPVIGGPVVSHPGAVIGVPAGDCDGSVGAAACPGGNCGGGIGVAAAGGATDPFSNRFYFGAEYLLWRVRGDQTPPLVTSTTAGGLPLLGQPTTNVVYGGGINSGPRSGGRFTGGMWFGDERCLGVELSGFFLAQQSTAFVAGGDEFGNVVGRPFFDIRFNPLAPGFELVSGTDAFGRALRGNVSVNQTSTLWGYEANLKHNCLNGPSWTLDALIGFRQLSLDEGLSIRESLTVVADPVRNTPVGTQFDIRDNFSTRNRFYGGQVGFAGEVWLLDRLSLNGSLKVGLGYTNARTEVNGQSIITVPGGGTFTPPAGLLAQGSNSGVFDRDTFSVVPEVGVNLGYYVTDWLRLSVGYNFLYWSNVSRVGEQVPANINFNNAFGGRDGPPAAPFTEPVNRLSNFWAHGITAGLEFRF
ncbi:MAG: BBP7 family outer membrane beta-barrel protein, partial [Gemmataceae bacterium]